MRVRSTIPGVTVTGRLPDVWRAALAAAGLRPVPDVVPAIAHLVAPAGRPDRLTGVLRGGDLVLLLDGADRLGAVAAAFGAARPEFALLPDADRPCVHLAQARLRGGVAQGPHRVIGATAQAAILASALLRRLCPGRLDLFAPAHLGAEPTLLWSEPRNRT
ncbi:hypothetical protein [Cellulomonas taurus]|uniref:hypothetical protein n=1 Tax=Cellulomonas taurus TaxID=2729175 RepID=UPI00145E000F|nr:hypothetical protein [Cellulomonas taurus]